VVDEYLAACHFDLVSYLGGDRHLLWVLPRNAGFEGSPH
jgi:hypothetical protein